MITLKVKTLDGRDTTFEVSGDLTIKEFKEHIAADVNISATSQRLIYHGRVLQDEKVLNALDLDDKTLHLVEKGPTQSNDLHQDNVLPPQHDHYQVSEHQVIMGTVAVPMNNLSRDELMHSMSHVLSRLGRIGQNAEMTINQLPANGPFEMRLVLRDDQTVESPAHARLHSVQHILSSINHSLYHLEEDGNANSTSARQVPSSSLPDAHGNETAAGRNSHNLDASASPCRNHSHDHERPALGAESAGRGANESRQPQEASTAYFASVFAHILQLQERLRPHMQRYLQVMLADADYGNNRCLMRRDDNFFETMQFIMHCLGHLYHSLSDVWLDFEQPPPRLVSPTCLPRPAGTRTSVPETEIIMQFVRQSDMPNLNLPPTNVVHQAGQRNMPTSHTLADAHAPNLRPPATAASSSSVPTVQTAQSRTRTGGSAPSATSQQAMETHPIPLANQPLSFSWSFQHNLNQQPTATTATGTPTQASSVTVNNRSVPASQLSFPSMLNPFAFLGARAQQQQQNQAVGQQQTNQAQPDLSFMHNLLRSFLPAQATNLSTAAQQAYRPVLSTTTTRLQAPPVVTTPTVPTVLRGSPLFVPLRMPPGQRPFGPAMVAAAPGTGPGAIVFSVEQPIQLTINRPMYRIRDGQNTPVFPPGRPSAGLATTPAMTFRSPPIVHNVDPFLPCSSRHFHPSAGQERPRQHAQREQPETQRSGSGSSDRQDEDALAMEEFEETMEQILRSIIDNMRAQRSAPNTIAFGTVFETPENSGTGNVNSGGTQTARPVAARNVEPTNAQTDLASQPARTEQPASSGGEEVGVAMPARRVRHPASSQVTQVPSSSSGHSADWQAQVPPQDWVSVIETDIRRQQISPVHNSTLFSDAYLNGMPPKRRKVIEEQKINLNVAPANVINEIACRSDNTVNVDDADNVVQALEENLHDKL